MARRRLQRAGQLYRDGRWWRLRFREDALAGDGTVHRIRRNVILALAAGPGAVTQRQAERQAWESILSKLDNYNRAPASIVTLGEFIEQRFLPEHVWTLKRAGKEHYRYCLGKILPVLGAVPLREITGPKLQALVRAAIDSGLSVQTAVHIRNAVSAVVSHAKRVGHFWGENPAALVRLPEMSRRPALAYTFEQARAILSALPEPVDLMALLAMTTSLNVAELCGLRWRRVNLAMLSSPCDGVMLPPLSLLVAENYYRGQFGTPKTCNRSRVLPIPAVAIAGLVRLQRQPKFTGPDDIVFCGRTGRPLDAHNISSRIFRPLSARLGFKITWHAFRHTAATLAEQAGMLRSDRIALMGHGGGRMTDLYTHSDIKRRRVAVDQVAEALMPRTQEQIQ